MGKRGLRRLVMTAMVATFVLLSLVPSFGETNCSFSGGVDRISGDDRYETSAKLARECFTDADSIVIATGENFADALSGAPLAAIVESPTLLTRTSELPAAVEDVIEDLDPEKAYILGGTQAVSTKVEDKIRDMGVSIVRLRGSDRFETSAMIANEIEKIEGTIIDNTAIVATGLNFPDALSASALAASTGMPILLVKKNEVPDDINDVFEDLDIEKALVIGGTSAISEAAEDDLDVSDTERLDGNNRYETARAVYDFSIEEYGMSDTIVYIASGTNFPDALVLAPVAALEDNAPLMLSNRGPSADPSVSDFFSDYGEELEDAVIIGGTAAITTEMENFIAKKMGADGSSSTDENLELSIDVMLTNGTLELSAHVEDEDGDDVENADLELTEYFEDTADELDEVCGDIDCSIETDEDGDAQFDDISVSHLSSGDEIELEVTVEKSGFDDDTDSVSVTIP